MTDLLVVDTSAFSRSEHPQVIDAWERGLAEDRLALTEPAMLEILFSARSEALYQTMAEELGAFRQVPLSREAARRALEVHSALARRHAMDHRSVGVIDLLIAAAAELAGATVWHYDSDYDRIAEVTGQPTEWVAPRGSL